MKGLQLLLISMFSLTLFAQETSQPFTKKSPLTEQQLKRWSHLDLEKDSIPGMSVDKTYTELLKNKKSTKVIVAVVDSGVDINQEDLKAVIWTNKKEIPNNKKDDDKNGFIDDVHGWNFLGDSNNENLEMTRVLKKADDGSQVYKNALADYTAKLADANDLKENVDVLLKADKAIREALKKDNYTVSELKDMPSVKFELYDAKRIMLSYANQKGDSFHDDLQSYKDYVYDQIDYNLNKDFNPRKLVGDNPEDINNKKYGNNVVYSKNRKDSLHGTHVAGIIAQGRDNGIGGDGVADNVEIMPVRAVPNGDEYDKDIALAIRYAVDNGAKVINGSFGKDFSPHAQWVYDAIKYAASKDVLIVHAAGNDAKDIDTEPNFPTDVVNGAEISDNVLTVGALNYEYGEKVIAKFSNYGKRNVDVYAPGVKIYATIPDNKYKYLQGTSMASPNAAGVATLIREYYPNLKAAQVKQILMQSGTSLNLEVLVDEKRIKIPFADTSVSGKIVNAYNALKMAEEMSNSLKNSPKL
ncbi:S8 family peptidase [Flavobacterium paronense]|uniref:S8 family peptidase n=1 Tax=Flavobacterium paronense TaxID=1392775 RepID=A0ABV5GEV3_9FLAO|nr:S8 family peptidase [Flavobacterium paronense]MDN3678482.1 S8 family peptidase [Flavobacterium paronense]